MWWGTTAILKNWLSFTKSLFCFSSQLKITLTNVAVDTFFTKRILNVYTLIYEGLKFIFASSGAGGLVFFAINFLPVNFSELQTL